jgi:cell shape-determining protein MreC
VLAAILLFMPQRYQEGLADVTRATILRPIVAVQRGAMDREGRFADGPRLRAERDSLASFLVGQSTLAAENRELRALLGFRERLTHDFVAAEGARDAGLGSGGLLRLSVGREDAVRDGAPVVTAEGLVGTIWRLGDRSAVVMEWTHPSFRVSVMTLDGETYGIAEPVNAPTGERMLALSPVAFHTVPDSGSMIVTSGDGGLYPRGIPVGLVTGEGRTPTGWQRTYLVRPLVTPAQMGYVLVLGELVRAPTDRDLASAWGVRLDDSPAPDTVPRVAPDAATPPATAQPQQPQPQAQQPPAQPRPRQAPRVDPTPQLPGRPVFPDEPRVPPGMPAPTQPQTPP